MCEIFALLTLLHNGRHKMELTGKTFQQFLFVNT